MLARGGGRFVVIFGETKNQQAALTARLGSAGVRDQKLVTTLTFSCSDGSAAELRQQKTDMRGVRSADRDPLVAGRRTANDHQCG